MTTTKITALPFSPLTRRGLGEIHRDLDGKLAHWGRSLIDAMDDPGYLDYLRKNHGDEMRRTHRLWRDVLDARSQRQTKREGAPRGDHMDGATSALTGVI